MQTLFEVVEQVMTNTNVSRIHALVTSDVRYGKMPLYVALDRGGAPLSVCGDIEALVATWPDAGAFITF